MRAYNPNDAFPYFRPSSFRKEQRIGRAFTIAETLLSPRGGFFACLIVLFTVYGIVPLFAALVLDQESQSFVKLFSLTTLGGLSMLLGFCLPIFDKRYTRLTVVGSFNPVVFAKWIMFLFLVFFIVSAATAPTIPIISALQGADSNTLSLERGEFFKGRTGAWALLGYMNAIFATVLVPYSVVHLFVARSKLRYPAAVLFLIYCLYFLVKALFLYLLLPFAAYFAATGMLRLRGLVSIGLSATLLLAFMFSLTGDYSQLSSMSAPAPFLSAQYKPSGVLDSIAWRSFAVPIFTAADTLTVHAKWFGEEYFFGSTSSLVSAIFGMTRVNLERFVFEYQFGGWNEIANSNAFFVCDAYANFGYIGVVSFGVLAGLYGRTFMCSNDIGYRCLWIIFMYTIFNGSLIGILLGNGFGYMLIHSLTFGGRRTAIRRV